ncbi:MAG: acylneuraminate cytidylyltransferase family protein [Sedimentisphaerales bacterium]|nr:acylneuraminate cytidylyltransferase family protein [Sedimentisphaerales bacterium]
MSNVLGIIPARGGSRGVPSKNIRELLDRPVITYTIEAALAAEGIDKVVVTTDDTKIFKICQDYPVTLLDRPQELAGDKARIDDAMRHCCHIMETEHGYKPDIVVLLYANVPVRAEGIIDKTIKHLMNTGADSVQTMTAVGKFHPYWLYNIDGDKATKYVDNKVYQRQDLPRLYMIDGAVGVVRYEALMTSAGSDDPHAFWGTDRRAVIQQPHETVDIDTFRDFLVAEAALREKELPVS